MRMFSHHEHAQRLKADEIIRKKEELEPLFQAWSEVALTDKMVGEKGVMDKDGDKYGINSSVPWGECAGGDVVLIALEKKVEVRAGDAFFFLRK
jgi:hypothetical protein